MDFFEFTYNEGDTFQHKYKAIEKYVKKNIKTKVKLEWKPEVTIQIFKDRGTVYLEKDLYDLNKNYIQTLYIQVCGGVTLYKHVSLRLKYLSDNNAWIVTYVNHDPLAFIRNVMR
ncbi:hypothetical protein SAMN05880501_11717 [Ureibacillus xyleni]|uniref:Uncharacterized protein n=1 Tax=Ureibacillus xyleni TaxID=614648 RepID=A0A285TNZ0_9BACL|nr:hypothetical protein [Ureibacillus xyleni]SOC24360.1 hypothetical protein SAMN05880501_11717 [Ureibacillus xyleni]